MKNIANLYADLNQFSEKFRELQRDILIGIGTETVKDVQNNFRNESFAGQAWEKRKYSPARVIGKRVLSDTTVLKKSILYEIKGVERVVIGVDLDKVPYAEVHNEGGTIPITPQMRKFFWARYAELSAGAKATKNKQRVTQATSDAQFWKNMALTKATHITIPKRQYIGIHPELLRKWELRLNAILKRYIEAALK